MDAFAADTKVEWREWGPDAFAAAERAGKPILLALTVAWSPECREMDRRTYGDPGIAANVNDGFVPIRVDADRSPQVRERYNMGGFPSTVFLTPDGEVISGATFLGPDGFRGILDSVRGTWDAKGADAGSVPRALRNARPPAGEVTDRIEEHMVEQLLAAYDDEFGGWGTDHKFPLPRTIEFALVRARDQATRTLEAIRTHLLDTDDGGFYRYATRRDWSGARRAKLLDENAAILRAFAHAYRYTGEDAYRQTADRAVDFLTTTLWEPDPPVPDDAESGTRGAFASSQAADDEYHRLEPTEREAADPPTVDRTAFADRNGLAVDGLLTLARYVDDDRPRRYAERARSYLTDALIDEDGAVVHYRTADEAGPRGLLVDQARVLRGLVTSWQVTGEPDSTIVSSVADWTLDNLRDDGAVRDGPTADAAGLCSRPLYPIDPTIDLADALVDLAALADDDHYRTAALEAIAASAGATDRMGVEVAGFAAVAARLRSPQSVAVGTPAGSDLHRAALRLADHETTVVPDADCEGAVRRVEGEPAGIAASPAELESLLTG